MTKEILGRIALLLLFTLAQALVLGRIHLFGCATPLLYVYFALLLPRNFPRWVSMSLCFSLGLLVDMFNNTPGIAAASMTFIGFLQPYMLMLYLDREDAEDFKPSIATMGWVKFVTYSLFLLLIYCVTYFSLEAFNFFNWQELLLCVLGSFLLTLTIILVIDSVRK